VETLQQLLGARPDLLEDFLLYARLRSTVRLGPNLVSTHQIYEMYRDLEKLDHEELHIVLLDSEMRLLHKELLQEGGPQFVFLDHRKALRVILDHPETAYFLIVHNHADRTDRASNPSDLDMESFQKLRRVTDELDLFFLRAVVISPGEYSVYVPTPGRERVLTWQEERIKTAWDNPWETPEHFLWLASPEQLEALGIPVTPDGRKTFEERQKGLRQCSSCSSGEKALDTPNGGEVRSQVPPE